MWSLEHVCQTQNDARTSGIPTTADPRADEELISKASERWDQPLTELLEDIRHHTFTHIEETLTDVLREWQGTAIFTEAHRAVKIALKSIMETHCHNAMNFLRAELRKPITFDDEDLHHRYQKELGVISQARLQRRAKAYLDYKEGLTGKKTEGLERSKKTSALCRDPKDLGPDPYKDQIEAVARVRGYYTAAANGLVNTIAKLQNSEIFHRCQRELGRELQKALNIEGRDGESSGRLQVIGAWKADSLQGWRTRSVCWRKIPSARHAGPISRRRRRS